MQNVKRLWGVIIALAVVILVLASLLVSRGGGPALTSPTPTPDQHQAEGKGAQIVAKIGDREITMDDLEAALKRHYGAEQLGQMLDRRVVQLEAQEQGVSVDAAELARELKRMQQGYESEQQYYEAMQTQLGMSKEEIQEDAANKLLLEKLATLTIQITNAEIDDYIKTHADEFQRKTEYHILQIIVSTKDQANKVLAELAKGESFAILARDRSIDDATNNNGGDLGWVVGDDPFVEAAVLETAKTLKVGQVSKPVPLAEGFAVVSLKEKRDQPNPDMAFIKENVRRELALQQAPPLKDYVNQLRAKWKVSILDAQLRQ
ncbi:peptidylprolyl isomerase [Paenibacillus whitsoniae]|uniref:peptidylprolyl isomerase n=1 Tax=Paenibacillus whitsoniae TaxID=2496558 RepID=A0A3S0C4T3_9BACL|nr:peptidylprolyl isomerase [Paenibacillus whitsoniae]RTE02538.1 peptidylprolyl isomerase [Paenibacillus whitsoniae]